MKFKKILILLLIITLSQSVYALDKVYRLGLFAGSSKGLNDFPIDDATRDVKGVEQLFIEYAEFDDTLYLSEPDYPGLDQALDQAAELIKQHKDQYQSVQFFFYYLGHGLAEGLLLNQEIFSKENLKKKLNGIDADLKIVFIDACYSQMMGKKSQIDYESRSKGTIFISSSSMTQPAFTNTFTPFLKIGLMGDADGIIPRFFDPDFFYRNFYSRVSDPDAKARLKDLYRLNETLYKRVLSRSDEEYLNEIKTDYPDLQLPPDFTLTGFNDLMSRIRDTDLKIYIKELYQYPDYLSLKNGLNSQDEEFLQAVFSRFGYAEDSIVSLFELYSYLTDKVILSRKGKQTPKINIAAAEFSDPVNLGFVSHKGLVLLNYIGTVLIEKIDSSFRQKIQIHKTMGENETSIRLEPGEYKIRVVQENAEYEWIASISPGVSRSEELNWNNLIRYRTQIRGQDRWITKKDLVQSQNLSKAGLIASPVSFALFSTLSVSFLSAGIYYHTLYQSQYEKLLNYEDVKNSHPGEYSLWQEYQSQRDNFYITSGISLVLPAAALALWIISAGYDTYYKKLRNRMEIKPEQKPLNALPEISWSEDKFSLGITWKL